MKTIYLWSDIRETSLHQKYIVLDYKETLEKMGFQVIVNQTRDWKNILREVKKVKPNLFFLHGDKIFDPDCFKSISKICATYVRWRWHPDPPSHLMDFCTIASKVSFVNESYSGKLFYSPHPAITKYFYPAVVNYPKYKTENVFFLGLAGKRGNNFYQRSGRNSILDSKYIRHLNYEMFGNRDTGFYEYPEIAKYFNGARLCLNVSSFNDEVNFNIFNITACKVPLIADTTIAMNKHFIPWTDYIPFNKLDINDFEKIVKEINNMSIHHIAQSGYDKIMKEHTPQIRLTEVLKKVGLL
jgi:hypothetical protein